MTSPDSQTVEPPIQITEALAPTGPGSAPLERRGRRWIFGSFAFCPCHLPLTLGILATVFGGTAAGAVLRDHIWVAGAVITAAWVAGTWRGFRLVRLAKQGACPLPRQPKGPPEAQEVTFGPAGLDRSPVTMTTDEKAGRSQR